MLQTKNRSVSRISKCSQVTANHPSCHGLQVQEDLSRTALLDVLLHLKVTPSCTECDDSIYLELTDKGSETIQLDQTSSTTSKT